jgi:hypothetical protein
MKRVIAGSCLAAAFAVGLSAQSAGQPPAPTPQTPPSSASSSSDKAVTVTGCLRAGDQPNSFVLSNAKWDDRAGASSAAGTAGTSGGASAAAGASVKLTDPPAGTDLNEHVGHMVQVTGKIDDKGSMASATPPAATGTGATGTSGTAGEQTGRRPSASGSQVTLDVDTLKMVSSTCDSK